MGYYDLVIATDNAKGGTSRNTGSDKQTYYRLNDSSNIPDSPLSMANSYLQGGAMHGDIAFVESQGSLQAFYNLIALGVPFPITGMVASLGTRPTMTLVREAFP